MKRAPAIAALALLATTGGLASVWYQSQISGDLKQMLVALVNPSSTKDDVHAYLREARLRAHTRKDRELMEKAERAVALDKEADHLSESNFAALMAETKNPYQFSGRFYSEAKLVGAGVGIARLKALEVSSKRARAENSARLDDSIAVQKSDAEESRILLDELRAVLGAPGTGRYVANMAPTYDVLCQIKKQNDGIQKITEDYMETVESSLAKADGRHPH